MGEQIDLEQLYEQGLLGSLKPRKPQTRMVRTSLNRYELGHKTVTVDLSAGTGKTTGVLLTGNEFIRMGEADYFVHLDPRLNLSKQIESESAWLEKVIGPYYELGRIPHRSNKLPLIKNNRKGYSTTYQSAIGKAAWQFVDGEEINIHLDFIRKNRVILCGDEAQFLASGDPTDPNWSPDQATKAGALIDEMIEASVFTILMSGTWPRSDGKLVLPRWVEWTPPDKDGLRYHVSHVYSGYAEGIAGGFLKPAYSHLVDAKMTRRSKKKAETLVLSEYEGRMFDLVTHPPLWQDIVDACVHMLLKKQKHINRFEQLLLACAGVQQARLVQKYLKQKYKQLRVKVALSDDEDEADSSLRHFRKMPKEKGFEHYDVLIAVRKAYIGYDAKRISVVGVLSHYRWFPHLEQLVMRGGRVRDDVPVSKQTLDIVGPDDVRMVEFLKHLRAQSKIGIKERYQGGEGDPPPDPEITYIDDYENQGAQGIGMDVIEDIDHEEYSILSAIAEARRIPSPIPQLAGVVRDAGGTISALKNALGVQIDADGGHSTTTSDSEPEEDQAVESALSREIHDKNKSLAGHLLKAGLLPCGIDGKPKWKYCNTLLNNALHEPGMRWNKPYPDRDIEELRIIRHWTYTEFEEIVKGWIRDGEVREWEVYESVEELGLNST